MSNATEVDHTQDIPSDADRVTRKSFRFKGSSTSKDSEGHHASKHSAEDGQSRRQYRRRHHHGKHKRQKLASDHEHRNPVLPPDIAFRESLFDALGDDEGAEFWQGVYGQPIHTYSRNYEDTGTGELGVMDDEQYAAYVRRRMWEKSAEGIEMAREARRKEKAQQEQQRRQIPHESESTKPTPFSSESTFDLEIEASLKRSQHRKDKKKWQHAWQAYLDKWRELQQLSESRKRSSANDSEQIFLRNKIAWPVDLNNKDGINTEQITTFFDQVVTATASPEDRKQAKMALVKSERVRWHPDKIQQRYGFMQIDQETMQTVTAVFQIIDRMWTEMRVNT